LRPDMPEAARRMRSVGPNLALTKRERFKRDSLDGFDCPHYKQLPAQGLLYPDYPKDMGGPGLSIRAAAAVYEVQCGDYGWHMLAQSATDMIGKIVHHFGSEEAKREIV